MAATAACFALYGNQAGALAQIPAHIVPGIDEPTDTWGTVVADVPGQADSWVVRLNGIAALPNKPMLEARYPAVEGAGELNTAGEDIADLNIGRAPFGKSSTHYARALGEQIPGEKQDSPVVKSVGSAYADAGGGSLDVRVPHTMQESEGEKPPVIGAALTAFQVSALAKAGKPVALTSRINGGALYIGEKQIADLGKITGVNEKVVFPGSSERLPLAVATVNEMVTTDEKGQPTATPDKAATSGYVNAVHISILGPEIADITIGHAAVLRKAPEKEKAALRAAAVPASAMLRGGTFPPFGPPPGVPVDDKGIPKGKEIDNRWWVFVKLTEAWDAVTGAVKAGFDWMVHGVQNAWSWVTSWF
ncbi:hypothetical protein SSPIM334S_02808 [Streptomyces spiroverticillatus]